MKSNILKIIMYALSLIIIMAGIICGIGVYKEITSKSYVNGDLLGIENCFKQENFKYKTNSIALYKVADKENEYMYSINLLPVNEFDGIAKKYEIIFNGNEILNTDINAGSVEFKEQLEFLNTESKTINVTDLTIRLEFYADKTKLKVVAQTNSIAYLQQYLELNSFSLRVNEIKE